MDAKRLLLIEDDPTIAELLAYNLRQAGYEVRLESDGRNGLLSALSGEVDLVLVDLMLPELDGMTVSCEISRVKPDVPIIVVTARTEREIMLEGFNSGADDFVTKPFDLDELLARIAARLRRSDTSSGRIEGAVSVVGMRLDPDSHVLATTAGEVFLKPKEYGLLELLVSQPGHLFRREEITRRVWHQGYSSASRTLDVHVRHVRAKLEQVRAPVTIQNVRGVGYRLDSEAGS
ncbi:MAG: response regulator transcription factor [Coriobacteriia bacterium]|nr:response regulator transcription factor [Coriobacteriia bacterium]